MRKVLLIFIVALILSACESEQVKPPSEDSELALQAFAVSESVRDLYVKKDYDAMSEMFTAEAYKEFRAGLRQWESVELTFTPRLVEIENDKVTLNVSWQGKWVFMGRTASERGMAVFEMDGRPLKISRIPMGSPFIYPVESK